jgi:hypothetical protein
MTKEEQDLILQLVRVYEGMLALPQYHINDMREAVNHIHALQNMIMAREAVRNNPLLFGPIPS